jgi:hypothetical protein
LGQVVARDGEPNDSSLGVLISNHRSVADALIAEITIWTATGMPGRGLSSYSVLCHAAKSSIHRFI